MIKLFLFDIEGTTTDIHFVHKVLFPYSYEKMDSFIQNNMNDPKVAKAIADVKATVQTEDQQELDLAGAINQLKTWIKNDRKHPALKELQGLIWDVGYSQGDFKGHLYPDVKPFFEKILKEGNKVGIYSSGSVHAQKLIFGFSIEGDLTPMISYYFDTKVGHKREKNSYLTIAQETKLTPNEIHFFSDIPEELEAAEAAGMRITQLLREGTPQSKFKGIADFSQFN